MVPEGQDADVRRTESAPGDIGRGTQETGTASPAAAGQSSSQDFAARQSFADPAHRGGSPQQARDAVPSREPTPDAGAASGAGGLRTQETGSEEGARTPARPSTTTTSRGSLAAVQDERQEGGA